jgi:hypothetical protein
MQLTAKLTQLLPVQTGSGKNGQWKKQDIIVETDGKYPKKVCLCVWGDKIDLSQVKIGQQLNLSFDIESREFNGRWYTDLKVFKLETEGGSTARNEVYNQEYVAPNASDEDMPF